MALFPRTNARYINPDSNRQPGRITSRRIKRIAAREPDGLPAFMKRLDLLCKTTGVHQLPVRMKFISESSSDRGKPMAIYACPACNWREGWIIDARGHSHRPMRLWAGPHHR
jgi:hypothetical protein